jgi:transcriptional regulator with XRE-family HTH domain
MDFARRLVKIRSEKDWSQSEVARRTALHTTRKRFGRDNISKYEKARSTPLPHHLVALAKALAVSPSDLIPERAGMLDAPMNETSALDFKQVGKNRAWIRLNQEVSMDVAYKILALMQGEG